MEPAPESRLDAILPAGASVSVTVALERARAAGHEAEAVPAEGARWAIANLEWRATLSPAPKKALELFAAAGRAPASLPTEGALAVSVFARLPPSCLDAYKAQVEILHALVPEAVAVWDANAKTVLSPALIRDIAEVPVPPPPTRLYSLHEIVRDHLAWIHTHGLRRCGTVELELLDVPEDRIGDMRELIRAAAARLIEEAAPPSQCAAFEVSHETKVTWIPWQKVVGKRRLRGPGSESRDPTHAEGTGVLLARAGRWRTCLPHTVIEQRPRVLVSHAESERMAAGARARWERFAALFAAHGADPEWRFLVKAAFAAEGPCRREHVWMQLVDADAEGWTGRVLSSPCHASIHEGDEVRQELGSLSGFQVRAPAGTFGPDELALLEDQI